jgi:hypothetical protein
LATQQGLQGWTAVLVQPCQVQKILQKDKEIIPEKNKEQLSVKIVINLVAVTCFIIKKY